MSKKILALVLTLTLIGCSKAVVIKDEKVDPTPTKVVESSDLKQKIENFDNYVVETKNTDFVPTCDDYSKAFAKKVEGGEVKKLSLYTPETDSYRLDLFLTPNYDSWKEADFEKIVKCGELAAVIPLKVVSDKVIWGFPSCSGGYAPVDGEVGYEDYLNCLKVEKSLNKYLGK